MSAPAALLGADLRRILRDPMLVVLALLPVALAAALRLLSPRLAEALGDPARSSLAAEGAGVVLLLLTPLMFGFLGGLLLLDERDEGVLTAVALTPVGKGGFLAYRTAVPVLWSALAGLAVLALSPAGGPGGWRAAALAALAGLEAPLLALFLGAFAASKVEGIALAKVGSVLVGVGALGVLAPLPWRWLFAVSPHFWLARLRLAGEADPAAFAALLAAALAVHGAALWLLARAFLRRAG